MTRLRHPNEEPLLSRLRKVQAWRRARLQRLINDPDIDTNDPDRRDAIRAAKRYTEVAMRAKAIRMGLIER
ncbi:hypothetical protein M2212_003113 [Bradyrhizobium elkanii]|uniref:hypothetical protein n=1 Tax=Bradyrhizobium elkanii TaxID=29448 RepID=UPI0021681D05|nr:hypothetical protein [Bradyrhizobium elkanii]MCS3476267.1 hypothetical protein [Bradyrhizobium elkanii]MCS3686662.1 hypothetical protein [Bradyrhizobium elkanii]